MTIFSFYFDSIKPQQKVVPKLECFCVLFHQFICGHMKSTTINYSWYCQYLGTQSSFHVISSLYRVFTNHLGLSHKPAIVSKFLQWQCFLLPVLECSFLNQFYFWVCNLWLPPGKSSTLMNFRCGVNYLLVHSCKIKHIWDKFCLLSGFKEWNCARNSTSAKAILTKGQLVDFREYSLRLSAGERNNEPVPVHIPEVTQACNSTLISFVILWGERNSFLRLSVN